jgi:hypothetical protein
MVAMVVDSTQPSGRCVLGHAESPATRKQYGHVALRLPHFCPTAAMRRCTGDLGVSRNFLRDRAVKRLGKERRRAGELGFESDPPALH